MGILDAAGIDALCDCGDDFIHIRRWRTRLIGSYRSRNQNHAPAQIDAQFRRPIHGQDHQAANQRPKDHADFPT